MRMIKTISGTILVALLAGCVGPKPTLQEKMAGMTAEERQDFLYHECRAESRYRSKKRHSEFQGDDYAGESSRYRMRMICERMHDQMTGEPTP